MGLRNGSGGIRSCVSEEGEAGFCGSEAGGRSQTSPQEIDCGEEAKSAAQQAVACAEENHPEAIEGEEKCERARSWNIEISDEAWEKTYGEDREW